MCSTSSESNAETSKTATHACEGTTSLPGSFLYFDKVGKRPWERGWWEHWPVGEKYLQELENELITTLRTPRASAREYQQMDRTHWTDKICLARPKISTKFVSAEFSIW